MWGCTRLPSVSQPVCLSIFPPRPHISPVKWDPREQFLPMLLEDYSGCDVDCDTKYVSRTNSLIYLMDKIKVSLIFLFAPSFTWWFKVVGFFSIVLCSCGVYVYIGCNCSLFIVLTRSHYQYYKKSTRIKLVMHIGLCYDEDQTQSGRDFSV